MDDAAAPIRPKRFRKQLLLPAEHGSWSWLLVPFLVGTVVARSFNLAVMLVLVGSLALFLLRQPAAVWLRIRQGRGRAGDGPIVKRLTLGLSGLGLICLLGLLALGLSAILWLALPVTGLIVIYVSASQSRQTSTRTLGMELAGAAGLALTAPAAYIAASGQLSATAWWLWVLLALQNVLGVLYVRQRLADTHGRNANRRSVLFAHACGFLIVMGLGVFQAVPLATAVPFLGFLIRAMWCYPQPRPIPHIKKFGFTEIGVELISGLIITLAYLA